MPQEYGCSVCFHEWLGRTCADDPPCPKCGSESGTCKLVTIFVTDTPMPVSYQPGSLDGNRTIPPGPWQ
jgi:hypothetical protein